ncbi:hypothetical protein COV20_00280 [Candidatus Woesearchaeota archaeon CG10_big_fil_rev_8_21_14_0_10_45_16]|nr:MAG: hypothetical protein COV20_00280 [Candidatus Woesearchaeota archaeon CG10_big_fil_rev_8_21_14_0_10_45_16]
MQKTPLYRFSTLSELDYWVNKCHGEVPTGSIFSGDEKETIALSIGNLMTGERGCIVAVQYWQSHFKRIPETPLFRVDRTFRLSDPNHSLGFYNPVSFMKTLNDSFRSGEFERH